jgi:hypothetical protein
MRLRKPTRTAPECWRFIDGRDRQHDRVDPIQVHAVSGFVTTAADPLPIFSAKF